METRLHCDNQTSSHHCLRIGNFQIIVSLSISASPSYSPLMKDADSLESCPLHFNETPLRLVFVPDLY